MSEIAEALERFRRGPEVIATALTGVGPEEADYAPAPEKWNIRQIVAHVADTELVLAHRFRQVVAEDNPTLMAIDQNAWAEKLDYNRRKPAQSLESFRRLRAENYEFLKGLPESAFERTGTHTERGVTSVRVLLNDYAQHAESHARQLNAVREQYKQTKVKK